MDEAIKIVKLSKQFTQKQALKDIDLTVHTGECIGLLGHNGAGKSTLIKIIVGILPHTSGEFSILDMSYNDDAKNNAKVRENIGYLPELPSLYPEFKVKEFLKFISSIKSKNGHDDIESIMEKCNLMPVAKSKIGEISKGYKQRVGLAQALTGSPKILVLDEVTSGLDPQQRTQIIKILRDEAANGKTVLFSSHSIEDTLMAADRIAFLTDGEFSSTFERPKNETEEFELRKTILTAYLNV